MTLRGRKEGLKHEGGERGEIERKWEKRGVATQKPKTTVNFKFWGLSILAH